MWWCGVCRRRTNVRRLKGISASTRWRSCNCHLCLTILPAWHLLFLSVEGTLYVILSWILIVYVVVLVSGPPFPLSRPHFSDSLQNSFEQWQQQLERMESRLVNFAATAVCQFSTLTEPQPLPNPTKPYQTE